MRLLHSARIGLVSLLPHGVRFHVNRLRPGKIMPNGWRRKALAVSIALGATVITGSPAHAAIAYSPLPKLPALSVTTLTERYDLNRAAMAKAATEAEHGGDTSLAHTL